MLVPMVWVMLAGEMRFRRAVRLLVVLSGSVALATGCGSKTPDATETPTGTAVTSDVVTAPTTDTATDTRVVTSSSVATQPAESAPPARDPMTIRVPSDAATIQRAVDQAIPGDLVLVSPGIYHESVDIKTSGITLRGTDRNTVILDGRDASEMENGVKVAADNVAIENMTVRRYTFNGVVFTKAYDDNSDDPTQHQILTGYKASYLTVANNQQYGLYAFFARGGMIDHVYASGHPDSGVYIGQCKPCDAVIDSTTAERNSIGYEGTNASGNLFIVNSTWSNNRIGLTPNSQNMERLSPQGDVVIVGNRVENNNAADAPATAQGGFGIGIGVAGGNRNRVERNLVRSNATAGILVTDLNGFKPEGNVVVGNIVTGNGVDLAFGLESDVTSVPAAANCFGTNTFATSNPTSIETVMSCASSTSNVSPTPLRRAAPPPDVDYRSVVLPGPQPNMSAASTAPASKVASTITAPDVAAISVPKE